MRRAALLAALLLAWPGTSPGHAAVPLSAYASQIVGAPTAVHCQAMTGDDSDDLGFTLQTSDADGLSTMAPDIYLAPQLCFSLARATSGQRTNPQTLGIAIEVLTHEAMHIRLNSANESMVACNAMLRIDRTIRLLGLGARLHALHEWAWASFWASPDEYLHDPVCRAHPHEGLVAIGPVKAPNIRA